MSWQTAHPVILGILHIVLDLLNLGEHLGIFLVAKQEDHHEEKLQRFFVIMFSIRGVSAFEGCLVHSVPKAIFNILIEIGEYILYMVLLPRTDKMISVATTFFVVLVIFYIFNLILVVKDPLEHKVVIGLDICLTPIRVILYVILYEVHVLCLFLENTSPFRTDLFESLMILNAFFGVISIYKLITVVVKTYATKFHAYKPQATITRTKLPSVWHIILFFVNMVLGTSMMIIGLIYTTQAFVHGTHLKIYDFVVYIIITVWYGATLLILVILLIVGCQMALCGMFTDSSKRLRNISKIFPAQSFTSESNQNIISSP